MVQQVTLHIAV